MRKIFYYPADEGEDGEDFVRKLVLKDHDGLNDTQIEIGITTDESGAPRISIGLDCEVFENRYAYELRFGDLLEIAARCYLDGHHLNSNHYYSFKHLASILRHYANLMDIQAEEEAEQNLKKLNTALQHSVIEK